MKKIIDKNTNSGNKADLIVMATSLEAGKYAHLKEMGIDNIVVGKNVQGIFQKGKTAN